MDEVRERASRSASSHPAEPAANNTAKPQSQRTATPSRTPGGEKLKKPPVWGVVAAIVAIVVVVAGWLVYSSLNTDDAPIDSSKYQAVSLVDGQLYFGKLSVANDQYMKLTDVYYLQPQAEEEDADTTDSVQRATTNQNFKLVKFTDVIYGPEDEIMISKSQVLFYENIKPKGKVAQLIEQYKKSH